MKGGTTYDCAFGLTCCGYKVLTKESRIKCTPSKPKVKVKNVYLEGSRRYYILNLKIAKKSKIISGTCHNRTEHHVPEFIVAEKDGSGCFNVTTGPFGSKGGSAFIDLPVPGPITAGLFRSGNVIDSVQLTYGGGPAFPQHGGNGGNTIGTQFVTERIINARGRYGDF